MNDKILSIIITAKDEASAVMAKVSAEADAASTSMSKMGSSFESTGRTIENLGSTMTRAFTVPIVGVGIAAGKMAMDFQQAMTYVRTDAGDTTDNIDQLSQSVLNLARTSQFSPDELANGLYHLASLGLRGADAMNALNTAQQMASVGGADLESTASALGAALVTGINGVQNYSDAAGTLDAIIGAGNMRMQDLVGSLGTGVLTAFKNAGLSLQEYGSALATLTDNGMDATESATRLRMTISMMTAPTGPAVDALKRLGMTQDQLGLDMQNKGLIPALQDLKTHLVTTYGTTAEGKVKMQQALSDMFGGGRSSSAIITLLDQLDRVQGKETQISEQSGEFASKVTEQQQTAAAKMKTAWSSIQVDLIELGSRLLPAVSNALGSLAKDIDRLSGWWDSLSDAQQRDIEKLGEVLIVGGPVLSLFGKMVGTFGTLMKLGSTGAGIFAKLFGGLSGAKAGVAGIEGIAAESSVATGSLGGLAAMLTGPVGVALLGTVATAGLAYVAYEKFHKDGVKPTTQALSDFNKLADTVGVQVTGTTSKVDLATLAQLHATDAQKMFNVATTQASDATNKYQSAQDKLADSQTAVQKAQDNVKSALDTFGQNSPQYQQAVDDLKSKQSDYDQKLQDTARDALDVYNKEGTLHDAQIIWNGTVADLASTQDYLNKKMQGGIGVIAQFGPTAANQVGAIDVLHAHIADVITSWNGLVANFGQQNADLNSGLQGLGSHIDRIQGQSSALNSTLMAANNSAITLQGSVAGASLQGGSSTTLQHRAGGGPVSSGTPYIVGEKSPELFIPNQSGHIVNPDQLKKMGVGSGSTFNMYGSINLGSADAVDRFFNRLNAQKEMGALGVGV